MEMSKRLEQAIATLRDVVPIAKEAANVYHTQAYLLQPQACKDCKAFEEIILSGRALTSEELEAYRKAYKIADYTCDDGLYDHRQKMIDLATNARDEVYNAFREDHLKGIFRDDGNLDIHHD